MRGWGGEKKKLNVFRGEGGRSKHYLQGACVCGGEGGKLGSHKFNVVMLELNWKIFACSNTRNIFSYLSRSQERSQTPSKFPKFGGFGATKKGPKSGGRVAKTVTVFGPCRVNSVTESTQVLLDFR